jgi:hypothetical protein
MDAVAVAAWLLVAGPLVGAIPVANPALLRVWSASREDHLAIVGAHRRAWALLNAGFVLATVATTAGLAVLAGALGDDPARGAALVTGAVAYAIGGAQWCAVLAIRTRATPALADLVAAGAGTEPAEGLLGAATGGLFASFVLATSAALVVLGTTLLLGGGVAPVAAGSAVLVGALAIGVLLATGDVVPAVLYLPTVAVGAALLLGS